MMDIHPSITTLGTSLVVAVVTAFLAVRLALKRFYSERLWEKKLATYTALIEAIHHVREHADTNLTFWLRGRDIPEEGEKKLTEKLQSSMAELRKQRDIGSFIISDSVGLELNSFLSELETPNDGTDWQEYLEQKLVVVDKFLPRIRTLAKADLQLDGDA